MKTKTKKSAKKMKTKKIVEMDVRDIKSRQISSGLVDACIRNNVCKISHLISLKEDDLLGMKDFGPRRIEELKIFLKKNDLSLKESPYGIYLPLLWQRIMHQNGFKHINDVCELTKKDLLSCKGMGPKRVIELMMFLEINDLSLKTE